MLMKLPSSQMSSSKSESIADTCSIVWFRLVPVAVEAAVGLAGRGAHAHGVPAVVAAPHHTARPDRRVGVVVARVVPGGANVQPAVRLSDGTVVALTVGVAEGQVQG